MKEYDSKSPFVTELTQGMQHSQAALLCSWHAQRQASFQVGLIEQASINSIILPHIPTLPTGWVCYRTRSDILEF